jgi:hypothetical protein
VEGITPLGFGEMTFPPDEHAIADKTTAIKVPERSNLNMETSNKNFIGYATKSSQIPVQTTDEKAQQETSDIKVILCRFFRQKTDSAGKLICPMVEIIKTL